MHRDVTIQAPAERIFSALTDPKERAAWQTSFDEAPLDGPMRVGSRIRATRRGSTSGSSYEFVVTDLSSPRRLAMEALRNGQLVATTAFVLSSASGEATHVRGEAHVKLSGLQKMLAPLVNAEMEKRVEAELAALKAHAER